MFLLNFEIIKICIKSLNNVNTKEKNLNSYLLHTEKLGHRLKLLFQKCMEWSRFKPRINQQISFIKILNEKNLVLQACIFERAKNKENDLPNLSKRYMGKTKINFKSIELTAKF